MDRSKLILLIHTLKFLRLKQVYYQVFYKVRNGFFKKEYNKPLLRQIKPLQWKDSFNYSNSFEEGNTFSFLNQFYTFKNNIDWNFSLYGKLWTYNLNYFDFLNQNKITKKQGLILIKDYIAKNESLKDGKEPYPISLRGINWIKFLSKNDISETNIDQILYNHYQILMHNIEYHLLGNHLLENGYSLLFGAYYFKDISLYKKAKKILTEELNEQILNDGGHFELSPMYHQILLHRLLDCINLIKLNPWEGKEGFIEYLKLKAIKMLAWSKKVTFKNGTIPMVNDSSYDIAASSKELFKYAKAIGLTIEDLELGESGYRMIRNKQYELFIDVGNVGPNYQPGHAHADMFNFEFRVKGQPCIVDTGVSTYNKGAKRHFERKTKSHNTVSIADLDQSQVWGGFRVGKRAKINSLIEKKDSISAEHNGYSKIVGNHSRTFMFKDDHIIISDTVTKPNNGVVLHANFHLHNLIEIVEITASEVFLSNRIKIIFSSSSNFTSITLEDYELSAGFNNIKSSKVLRVSFKNHLNTTIKL
ncbi:alginate lyase family protein [Flavobacteriaceae bacterium MHTCC 0001]